MNKDFIFDAGDDAKEEKRPTAQSPWEFSGYATAVDDEHRQRNTTSIDHKILQRVSAGKAKGKNVSTSGRGSGKEKKELETAIASDDANADDDEDESSEDSDHDDVDSEEEEEDDNKEHFQFGSDAAGDEPSESDEEDGQGREDLEDDEDEEASDSKRDAIHKEHNRKSGKKGNGRLTKPIITIEEGRPGGDGKSSNYFSSAESASFTAVSFMELNISRPLIRACEALGYKQPTPIQAACIPLALSGRDICGSAVTGSGKTAAFALPLLERLLFRPRRIPAIRVLILTPTRELAVQLHSMMEKLAQFTDIRCCLVVGGLSSKVQEVALRTHPDIVIATPGRMIDHLRNTQSVGLEDLAILVLDEADRLLELGFREEIHELVRLCPAKRQTMLFSATMTEEVAELIKLSLKSPVRLSADPSTQRPSTLSEEVIRIRPGHEGDKEAVVLTLCSRTFTTKTIIFSGTKIEAHRLKILFGLSGLKAAELHGNLTQAQRLEALEAFRKQAVDFLIATDVAARGLDIVGVETVINFECPKDITTYVHRVGRTARAGRQGCAITLMPEQDRSLLKAMAKRAGSKLQKRVVGAVSVAKWRERIEKMEKDVAEIIRQEREEKALRKAEMEVNKAQNMMDHEAEIYSRPKKTWFQSHKDKTLIAQSTKVAKDGPATRKVGLSVNEAEERKKREKRKAEKEKSLPRKKRRRLEAVREAAEDDDDDHDDNDEIDMQVGTKKGSKRGELLVDIGYKRAKAAKAVEKAREAGKLRPRKVVDKKKVMQKNRKEEMHDLFQSDFGEAKRSKKPAFGQHMQKKKKPGVSKRAFKSKARYKRR